jgi:TPR repeat protein
LVISIYCLLLFLFVVERIKTEEGSPAAKEEAPVAAAGTGNAEELLRLGIKYYHGKDVAEDKAEAAKWFRRSAEQGNAEARFNLGVAFYNGEGVAQDKVEAAKWFRLAADQGNVKALFSLALAYFNGGSVGQDRDRAFALMRRAADLGSDEARLFLDRTFGERTAKYNNSIK